MRIELRMPGELVPSGSVVIEKLPHGTNIVTLVTGAEDTTNCDALITENKEITIGIKTADCAPVCVSDGNKIGIAHIGWRGLCAGLAEKTLGQFDTGNMSVHVAPFLHSFEIQRDACYERIVEKFGEQFVSEESGKLVFQFKDALQSLLPAQTTYDARSTATDLALPSYRRNKTEERFVTLVSFS